MEGDDATDEAKVQVVGRSRELRIPSTEPKEEHRVRELPRNNLFLAVSACGDVLCNSLDLPIWAWAMNFREPRKSQPERRL